ncbi:MAG: chromosome partition protein MukE [Deferrisomatales bacterium]|nr:chromosome partition protein MukE [Deferrisomatales bacterium]
MIEQPYTSLEDVIQDPVFPDVDLALRRGRHIDLDDSQWFAFLAEAQSHLELFYRRFGSELIRVADGYFYLLPSGDRLGRRQLSRGEMLVGQGLALLYLDPATVKAAGVVPPAQLLELLVSLVGQERLVVTLNFRKNPPKDARIAEEMARKEIAKALRGLERLGFVERLPDDLLRLRTPLMRFTDPVRGLADPAQALARLVERGEVTTETEVIGDQDENGAAEDEENGE